MSFATWRSAATPPQEKEFFFRQGGRCDGGHTPTDGVPFVMNVWASVSIFDTQDTS